MKQYFLIRQLQQKKKHYLYDQLLEYKILLCKSVIEEFSRRKSDNALIDVYCKNNYPCVMVQVGEFSKIEGEINSLYKIIMAYFIGITNCMAKSSNIPIELVNRAGFGHNIPSVSVTSTSFRINIGIVPVIYAEKILVDSLKCLNHTLLIPLLLKHPSFRLNLEQKVVNEHNKQLEQYNEIKNMNKRVKAVKLVENWYESDSLLGVLCKVGDSSGKKVSYQISRQKKYVDKIIDYFHAKISKKDYITEPLRKMLQRLSYSDTVTLSEPSTYQSTNGHQQSLFFNNEEDPCIQNDEEFWNMITIIYSAIKSCNKVSNESLSRAIEKKKMKDLHSMLERANLEFIRNSDYQVMEMNEDGYGSSSDCEVEVTNANKTTKFYSRKITLTTGMRAINMAISLSSYITLTPNFDTIHMFYQTIEIIKKTRIHGSLELSKELGL